jgi:hypothetical protein
LPCHAKTGQLSKVFFQILKKVGIFLVFWEKFWSESFAVFVGNICIIALSYCLLQNGKLKNINNCINRAERLQFVLVGD